MFSTQRHCFVSRATQRELPRDVILSDTEVQRGEEVILMVPIRLRFFKLTGRGTHSWIGAPGDVKFDGEPILINEMGINFNLSLIKSRRRKFRAYMATKLAGLGVPEYEQSAILREIDQAVEVAVPHVSISVIMVDVTVRLFGKAVTPIIGIMADLLVSVSSSQVTIDTDTMEYMETYVHEPITTATKTFIEGLENLRIHDLEEGIVRQASPCVICLEQLDHFDADLPMVVIRLPCSHLYHRACIIGWLERSNLCPLCQYAMPSDEPEERREPPKPSWAQEHWPMLLMLSAGGVITATIVRLG